MDNDKTLEEFTEVTLDDISLNSTEFEYDSDSISNDIKIEDCIDKSLVYLKKLRQSMISDLSD